MATTTKVSLTGVATKELSEELQRREGVTTIRIEPHEEMKIITGHEERTFQGPAIIHINQD